MIYQILVFTIHEKIIKSCNNSNFKISAPIRNQKLELPDESYSISDVQDYFEYILEKHGGKLLIHYLNIDK